MGLFKQIITLMKYCSIQQRMGVFLHGDMKKVSNVISKQNNREVRCKAMCRVPWQL